jgi:preprotein translocase subunit SecY
LPLTIVGFSGADGGDWTAMIARILQHGQPLYMTLYAALIIFFASSTPRLCSTPKEMPRCCVNMAASSPVFGLARTHGGLSGLRADAHHEHRCALSGVHLYVAGNADLEILDPFYFGGTSLLIVVSVTLDTVAQMHSHMIAHQYEGLIKKAKLRGRGDKVA